jgi:solute carrier family 25 (adenine nucleotide translocator) protein 4/5/6/31
VSNVFSHLCIAPLERAKFRRQLSSFPIARETSPESWWRAWDGNFLGTFRFIPLHYLNAVGKTLGKSLPNWAARSLISGSIIGGFSLLFVYPLDTIRTLQAVGLPLLPLTPTNFWKYYSGYGISLAGIVVYRLFYFGLYDSFGTLFGRSSFGKFSAAITTSVLAGALTYPLDTIRRSQMLARYFDQPSGVWDVCSSLYHSGGVGAFMAGADVNILRTVASTISIIVADAFIRPLFFQQIIPWTKVSTPTQNNNEEQH